MIAIPTIRFAARHVSSSTRRVLVSSGALVLEGPLQRLDGALSIKADRFFPLEEMALPARDFR